MSAPKKDLTYRGIDWRIALERNVTVSLEFAKYDLEVDPPNVDRAWQFVQEALGECQRLLNGNFARPVCHPKRTGGSMTAREWACLCGGMVSGAGLLAVVLWLAGAFDNWTIKRPQRVAP